MLARHSCTLLQVLCHPPHFSSDARKALLHLAAGALPSAAAVPELQCLAEHRASQPRHQALKRPCWLSGAAHSQTGSGRHLRPCLWALPQLTGLASLQRPGLGVPEVASHRRGFSFALWLVRPSLPACWPSRSRCSWPTVRSDYAKSCSPAVAGFQHFASQLQGG